MKYTATIEIQFREIANCGECRFEHHNDLGDVWCALEDQYLVKNEQDLDTCECIIERLYTGLRPVWCPLRGVEE
jgi:hypothetical protein